MGRTPCCDKANVKKGPWSPEEDEKLKDYIHKHGTAGNWISLPQKAELRRCGKSCRLRWLNYLRPDIKHGDFSEEEDRIICNLYTTIGTRWSVIAAQLPGRTDNDIKNYWNTKLKKKQVMGINNIIPNTQKTNPHGIIMLLPSSTTKNSSSSNNSSSPLSSYSDPSLIQHYPNNNGPFSTLLEPISFSANLINYPNTTTNLISTTNNNNVTPLFNQMISQDQSFLISPTMGGGGADQNNYDHHVKADNHSLLVFGGDQASCSSSDAEYGGGGGGGGGGVEEMRRRSMSFVECCSSVNNGWNNNNNNNNNNNERQLDDEGMWMETTTTTPLMDYGLEEIKQLISSSSCSNNVLFL